MEGYEYFANPHPQVIFKWSTCTSVCRSLQRWCVDCGTPSSLAQTSSEAVSDYNHMLPNTQDDYYQSVCEVGAKRLTYSNL